MIELLQEANECVVSEVRCIQEANKRGCLEKLLVGMKLLKSVSCITFLCMVVI